MWNLATAPAWSDLIHVTYRGVHTNINLIIRLHTTKLCDTQHIISVVVWIVGARCIVRLFRLCHHVVQLRSWTAKSWFTSDAGFTFLSKALFEIFSEMWTRRGMHKCRHSHSSAKATRQSWNILISSDLGLIYQHLSESFETRQE